MMPDERIERRQPEPPPQPDTLDFFVKARSGKKRNYVFDYGKSIKCSHETLKEIMRGGNQYRCLDCNYVFFIVTAFQQPLHNIAISGAFQLLHFAKEFGMDALAEVLRRPIGQDDGSPHKPVLPEGMSFMDVLAVLEEVETTSEDGGAKQLKEMIQDLWEENGRQLPSGEREDGAKALTDSDAGST